MGNISTLGYVRSEALVKWAIVFIYVQVIVAIVGIVSGLLEYSLIQDVMNNTYPSDDSAKQASDSNQVRQAIVVLIQALVYVITAILILKWVYRANCNARELGADNLSFTPAMSVVWFFVPIMGLWKPYQAMLQIWKASYEPVNWKSAKGHPVVATWWWLWLGTVFIGFVSFYMAHRAYDLNTTLQGTLVEIMSDFTTVLSTLAMLVLIKRVHQAQLSHIEAD